MSWQDFAIQSGDPSMCNYASHPDVCIAGFTQSTGDGSACSEIGDSNLRDTCIAYDRGVDAVNMLSNMGEDEIEEVKGCLYDSECSAICVGNVVWKQGCDPREHKCIKTFDTDCTQEYERFRSVTINKVCNNGVCVRNDDSIQSRREELENEKLRLKLEMAATSVKRGQLINAKDEANRNCLGGLSDATVILMNELATKSAGVIAGGVSIAGDATKHVISWTTPIPDYINKGLDDMSKAGTDQQKLTLDEYIILNCKLNDFFNNLLDESDEYLDRLLEEANEVDAEYEALP